MLHRDHQDQAVFHLNQIHVVQAVHAWTDAYEVDPWFVLGLKSKSEGLLRDNHRSWFWVKAPFPTRKGVVRQ